MANENLLDIVERLDRIVTDLKLALYGSPEARSTGLFAEFDTLRTRVERLERDVEAQKQRRPNVWLWVAGYWSFVAAVAFGAVALLNTATDLNLWDAPTPLSGAIAAFFAVVALVLFLLGFGWLDK